MNIPFITHSTIMLAHRKLSASICRTLLTAALMLSTLFAFTQSKDFPYYTKSKKAIAYYEKALRFYDVRDNDKTKENLLEAIDADSNFVEAHTLLAYVAFDIKDYEYAIKEYSKAIAIAPDYFINNYYNLAKTELAFGRYADAKEHLEKFLSYEKLKTWIEKQAQWLLQNAEFGVYAVQHPVPFAPINLGTNINTENDEYLPTITVDEQTLIITRRENLTINNKIALKEDFYISNKINNQWTLAENLGAPINTDDNEGAQCLSPDGHLLFFTGCHREDGKGSCDLYVASKVGDYWSKPLNLGFPINTQNWESQPSISADGKTLYFVSNRSGGKGKSDIWTSTLLEGGKWSQPASLSINTEGMDMSPFIHPDNQTLFFASDGHIGMGGMDIYYVKKDSTGEFGTPINLGYPINTTADENSLIVSASGVTAYFSSNREDAIGKMDLYAFELYEGARPQRVTYIKGKVYDTESKQPLGAELELIDLETEKIVASSYSNSKNGEYLICLPVNKNYAFNASAKRHLFYSENFSLKNLENTTDPFLMDIPLQPIRAGETLILKNIFFDTDKYELKKQSATELNKIIAFMRDNSSVHIEIRGHTDNKGIKAANQVLSQNRAKAVYDYLIQLGMSTERMTYKGYGDSQPIATNETEEGRAKNRRTEFNIISY